MWSLRNHGGYTLLMQFCSMASPTLQLCFVKCSVYLFVDFQKKYVIKSVCVRVSTAILLTKTKSYENVDISSPEQPYSV